MMTVFADHHLGIHQPSVAEFVEASIGSWSRDVGRFSDRPTASGAFRDGCKHAPGVLVPEQVEEFRGRGTVILSGGSRRLRFDRMGMGGHGIEEAPTLTGCKGLLSGTILPRPSSYADRADRVDLEDGQLYGSSGQCHVSNDKSWWTPTCPTI